MRMSLKGKNGYLTMLQTIALRKITLLRKAMLKKINKTL
jgi:hypothetical protein